MNRLHQFPLGLLAAALFASAAQAASPGNDPAALAKIRDAALQSDYAWERMADMTDLIGPRLSGSPGAAAAVTQVAEAMRKLGAKVTLQPVKVPHWVRGQESAELVEYRGRPGLWPGFELPHQRAAHGCRAGRGSCAGALGGRCDLSLAAYGRDQFA